MITSLRLVNFKNFADETLSLGPFTLIVGANASGKSNIRDAFRFLHGIGRGYTLPEIIGGKYGAGGQVEWEQIRGAPNEIARSGQAEFSTRVDMKPAFDFMSASPDSIVYFIKIDWEDTSSRGFKVADESLTADSETPYATASPLEESGKVPEGNFIRRLHVPLAEDEQLELVADRPRLHQAASHFAAPLEGRRWIDLSIGDAQAMESSYAVIDQLLQVRFLELSPDRMREPSFPGAHALGDTGENLATILERICDDSQRKELLTSWLDELTPMDVVDFEFPRDPTGRVHLQLVEQNGRRVSAYSASDGTLRFLGMLGALLNEDRAGLYFFEEIDNGIHPARLSLLIELIERQTAKGGIQVVATTHSPGLLDLVNDTTFENTSLVYRGEESADAVIRPVSDLPRVRELRESQGLGRLHASGWMEDMLAFTEAEDEHRVGGA